MLRTVTEFALGCHLVLGPLLLLAGLGDSGGAASASWPVQLLPLSGFVVFGGGALGIRTIRRSAPRRAAATLIGIAAVFTIVAVWIALASSTGRGLGSLLVVTAVPPFVEGLLILLATGPRRAPAS
jgi:hypothetical protein